MVADSLFGSGSMRYLFLLLGGLWFSSCAALSHLDGALRLKEYSDDKAAQVDYVTESNRKFDVLWALVEKGETFKAYRRKDDFIAKFGEPILAQPVKTAEGRTEERLLYRYATRYFNGPKVYVFFDAAGQLIRVEKDGSQQ